MYNHTLQTYQFKLSKKLEKIPEESSDNNMKKTRLTKDKTHIQILKVAELRDDVHITDFVRLNLSAYQPF